MQADGASTPPHHGAPRQKWPRNGLSINLFFSSSYFRSFKLCATRVILELNAKCAPLNKNWSTCFVVTVGLNVEAIKILSRYRWHPHACIARSACKGVAYMHIGLAQDVETHSTAIQTRYILCLVCTLSAPAQPSPCLSLIHI